MVAWPCEVLLADCRQAGREMALRDWKVPLEARGSSCIIIPAPTSTPQPTHIEETCLRGQPLTWKWPRRAANRRCMLVSEVTEWDGGTSEALRGAFNQPRAAHNPPTCTVGCLVGWRALVSPTGGGSGLKTQGGWGGNFARAGRKNF